MKKALKNLTLFDWLFIIVIIGAAIFFTIQSLKKNQWITIEIKITQPYNTYATDAPPFWIVDKLKIGDNVTDTLGRKTAEIVEIKSWGDQQKETWITLKIQAKANPKQKKYTFNYQPVEIGRPMDLSMHGVSIRGIVTYIEGIPDTRTYHELIVQARLVNNEKLSSDTRGVEPWVANAILEKQAMTDTAERTVVQIQKKQAIPAERVITTSTGRIFTGSDPIKKDVYLTLVLKATEQNGQYFFLEDRPIKVNAYIPLVLPSITVFPVITKVEYPKNN